MKKNLYEIYNIELDKTGKYFALCDSCYKEWIKKLPKTLMVKKLGENTKEPCNHCEFLKANMKERLK